MANTIKYEIMFIIRPDLSEEEINGVAGKVKGIITDGGGEILKEDFMGMRRLAYPIRKYEEGVYVLYLWESSQAVIDALYDSFKTDRDILRPLITVVTKNQIKEIDRLEEVAIKRKAEDERRAVAAAEREAAAAAKAAEEAAAAEAAAAEAPAEEVAEEAVAEEAPVEASEEAPVAEETAVEETPVEAEEAVAEEAPAEVEAAATEEVPAPAEPEAKTEETKSAE